MTSLKARVEAKAKEFAERTPDDSAPLPSAPAAGQRTAPGRLFFDSAEVSADKEELQALRAQVAMYAGAAPVREIGVDLIDDNPHQPRKVFDQEPLDDLIASIEANGLAIPIMVRPGAEGRYILVGGERRLRAFRAMGRPAIPAAIHDIDETRAAIVSTLENLARVDLYDFEKYLAFVKLLKQGISSQRALAASVGYSQTQVVRIMSYGKLPTECLATLEAKPNLFGANCAVALAQHVQDGKSKLVREAVRLRADNHLTSDQSITEWIRKQLSTRTVTEPETIKSSNGEPVFSLRTAGRQITLSLSKGVPAAVLLDAMERIRAAAVEAAEAGQAGGE